MDDTKGCHARFSFLDEVYKDHLVVVVESDSDDAHDLHHRARVLMSYLMYLVDTFIFMDKSVYYVNVVYLKYFIDYN